MGFHPARIVHTARINFEPTLGRLTSKESCATHIGDLLHRLLGRQAMGNFHDGPLGIAIQQQVALGIDHYAAAHLVAPVVVVGNATQRSFDAPQNHRHIFERLTATLAVHDGRAVGPFATHVARCVGIVTADLPVRGVAVDHGIHIARGHTPKQVGFAQGLKGVSAGPVRLRNDAHPKTLVFQHAANHGHAETGVVYIRVTRYQNDVAAVPAQLVHFGAAHGQKRGRAKTRSPVLAVAGQRLGSTRKERNVEWCVHRVRCEAGSVRFYVWHQNSGGHACK